MSRGFGRRVGALGLVMALMLVCVGCGLQLGGAGKGELTLSSRASEQLNVGSSFTSGFFSVEEDNALTVVLLEGDPASPTAALTVRMFWRPRVGATPIDATATNASIHYVVFGSSLSNRDAAEQTREVGLYSGAGFLYLNSDLDADRLKAGLWEAHVRLADRSEHFVDQVGPSLMAGSVRAVRDDDRVNTLLQRLGQLTSDRLGYPRLVRHTPE